MEKTNKAILSTSQKKLILLGSYLFIWMLDLVSFWFLGSKNDAIGYSVLYLYILLPLTSFLTSFTIGYQNLFNKTKWILPAMFGIMYMLSEYLTFSLSNNISFHKINPPEWSLLLAGAIISLIGMAIGSFIYLLKRRSSSTI